MATSVGQDDVEKLNDDKPNVQNVDGLVHEGDLPNYKLDDNTALDKKEGDGVGVGLDGGADAKASGLECILNQSSTESTNKKKRKNKKKKRNNKVGVSDSGGLGENQENLVGKDSDDASVASLTVDPDVETVVEDIEKKQSIPEQAEDENQDQELNKESDAISIQSTEPDVETVVKEIEKKQAISEHEAEVQVVKNEELKEEIPVQNESELSQVQGETVEMVEPAQGLVFQNESDMADNVDNINEVQQVSALKVESEHELDYNKIISQSALDSAKVPNFENQDESALKEVVKETKIESQEFEISGPVLADTELTADFDITLQPSVNFIFQSDGNNQIGPCESSAHFTESESALAAELNAASGSGLDDASIQDNAENTDEFPKQDRSENTLRTSSADSVGDQSEDNLSEFCDPTDPLMTEPNYFEELQAQHNWTRIDTSHLQPDDIFNHNFLQCDSQDFENRWENDSYLRQGSDTSVKMPTVPNPSLDNIELSGSDQALSELQPGFGKNTTDFLENKVAWKEQYPNFVGKVQSAVGEIVDTATNKMEALMNRQDENESPEGVLGLDLGIGLIRESGTKASDSMNNLYEVEGDLEYAARYGTNSSENFSYENPLNGETPEAKSISSQGFLVDGAPQGSNDANFGGYETLNNLDCDHFDYGDALPTQDLTEGLAQLDEEFKSTNESDDVQSQDNEVFYDAKSNSNSSYQSTTTSPRGPHLTEMVVEETLDISFNSKVQYFESEVQKVALSSSQQHLKTPSRPQSKSNLLDPIASTSGDKTLLGQTNANAMERQNEVKKIEVLVPGKSKPKYKRLEEVKSWEDYVSGPKNYEGVDWTKYTIALPKKPRDESHQLTFDELAAALRIRDEDSQENVQETGEVVHTPQNPFEVSETQFEEVPLRPEVPFEEVQQKYDRPLTNERKCGSLKRAVPCLFQQTPVSAPNSEANLLNVELDGTRGKTGSLSNKPTGQPNPEIAGTSGYNSTERRTLSLERRRLPVEQRNLDRESTLERLRRWKTQSLKRFSKN